MINSEKKFDFLFQSRVANHIGFWLLIIFLFSYHGSLFGSNFRENFIEMLVRMPVQMMVAYFLLYYQIPQWLYKRKWIKFFLSFILQAYLFSALARLVTIYIAEPITGYESYDESVLEVLTDPMYLIRVYLFDLYIPSFLLFIIKTTSDRLKQEKRLANLEKEKSETELNFLKAQMNPHFLFNTLNNIYSLSKSNSEQTSEMIMKLSELLDYTIYECNEARVPVLKEWQLIENYIDLHTMRHSEDIMISIDNEIENEDAKIAPLILITLVENAFKHSSFSKKDEANIRIYLKVDSEKLSFEIFNTRAQAQTSKISKKKGIGVNNVKRQLALQYPNNHTIVIDAKEDSYKVSLTITM